MVKYHLTYPVLALALLAAASCSQEEPDLAPNILVVGDQISFVADVPGVSTRTNYDVSEQFLSSGFTVSAISPEDDTVGGILPIHFEDITVIHQVDDSFRGDSCRWSGNANEDANEKNGRLKFFAFHPSRVEMKQCAGVGNECFEYANSSTKDASGVSYDYRLTKFRVAPDISKQVDFVTAIGEGNKTEHLYCGIKLAFEHQLCGVEVGVWGASTLYDVEIAGVRIGGIVVEADFNLATEVEKPAGDENSIGSWLINDSSLRGHVDYVFTTGDKVVVINDKEHNTKDKASSIMGSNGGKAMVIPYKYDKWDHTNDKTNAAKGMYFSALIRMTQHDGDHHRIYPSTDPDSQDHIVFLSVRKSDGTVMERLDKNGNVFGTSTKYDIPSTEELRHYGWAAAPANVEWKAGYTYSYVLDYTRGVGVHDPADPDDPASTIVDWGGVGITTYDGLWGNGEIINNGDWGANTNKPGPDGTIWWK